MQQSRWPGLTRMWTDGVIHHSRNPLILLLDSQSTLLPCNPQSTCMSTSHGSAVSEDKTQRPAWKDGRHERGLFLFSVSESKHHFGEDCQALNELSFINIHRSLLLSLLPYCDRLAARPNSLRSLRALTSRGDSRKRISTVKRNMFIWWEEIFMYSERDTKNTPAENHAHLKSHFMSPVWLFYWLFFLTAIVFAPLLPWKSVSHFMPVVTVYTPVGATLKTWCLVCFPTVCGASCHRCSISVLYWFSLYTACLSVLL